MDNILTYDVIVATYNGEKYVKEQIESILSQSVPPQHIYIRDDGSKDCTVTILDSYYRSRDDITIISGENLGYIKNFEALVQKTTSDIVFFSDQDDVWLVDKAKTILDVFCNNIEALTVFSDAYVTNESLGIIGTLWDRFSFSSSQNSLLRLLENNYVTGATMAVRRSFLNEVIPFHNKLPHDYYIAINAVVKNGLYPCELKLMQYRQHSSNVIGVSVGKPSVMSRLVSAVSYHGISLRKNKHVESKRVLNLIQRGVMSGIIEENPVYDRMSSFLSVVNIFYRGRIDDDAGVNEESAKSSSIPHFKSVAQNICSYVAFSTPKSIVYDIYAIMYFSINKNR